MRFGWLVVAACAGCASVPTPTLHTGGSALAAWSTVSIAGTRIALRHPSGGAITASVLCDKRQRDASLDVLTNHLLFELEQRTEHGPRQSIVIDGRAALRTQLTAKLDGVPVELDLVVLKKNGCVVDANLIASAARMPLCEPDFDRFVAGLAIGGAGVRD